MPGRIVIFNRSHHEDVLVPLVKGTQPETVIEKRYQEINAFEIETLTDLNPKYPSRGLSGHVVGE